MKRALITLLCCLLGFATTLVAAEPKTNPFQSVIARGEAVLVTLPAKGRWLVAEGSTAERLSVPSETFSIAVGTSLRLSERHTTYHFRAILAPEAGLSVHAVFDARSFGGQVTESDYFIKAQ